MEYKIKDKKITVRPINEKELITELKDNKEFYKRISKYL